MKEQSNDKLEFFLADASLTLGRAALARDFLRALILRQKDTKAKALALEYMTQLTSLMDEAEEIVDEAHLLVFESSYER